MTDILDHLQPDSPLYEATRDAAREEISRLRFINKELAEALSALQRQALQSTVNDAANEWGMEALAMTRAALTKYRGKE